MLSDCGNCDQLQGHENTSNVDRNANYFKNSQQLSRKRGLRRVNLSVNTSNEGDYVSNLEIDNGSLIFLTFQLTALMKTFSSLNINIFYEKNGESKCEMDN